jgi:hypothetical protein
VIVTGIILLIPFIAMQFSNEVQWSLFDFIFAGVLIFGIGASYKLITRKKENLFYRIAVFIFLVTILILIWVNGAVGILGSEDNPANLLYGGVILIGIIGSLIAQFKPKGMTLTLFIMAAAQILVPIIAFFIWKPRNITAEEFIFTWHDNGLLGVIGVNALFVVLFLTAAMLFSYDVHRKTR